MRPGRRLPQRDHPAARAQHAGQRPLGHLPGELHVDDLRPPRLNGLRAVQGRPAGPAFRLRRRVLLLTPVRIRFQAFPLMAGLPALLWSLLRSRSDCCRARRASFAPIRSFELGVPESELSIDRRRSTSASRNSSRRSLSSDASRAAASAAICSSFAPITARSRETRLPCSPPAPGSSGTSRKHAQPS